MWKGVLSGVRGVIAKVLSGGNVQQRNVRFDRDSSRLIIDGASGLDLIPGNGREIGFHCKMHMINVERCALKLFLLTACLE